VRQALREHGSVYEIDVAALTGLEPDLVLTQGICDVCAVPERDVLASVRRLDAQVLSLDAHDVGAIVAGIHAVGVAGGVPDRATACVHALKERVAAVRARVAGRPRPRVIALEWLDPPYVPGHWIPELIDAAGGELLFGERARPSFVVHAEALRGAEPDVLLVMPCGFALADARDDATRHAAMLRTVAPRAVGEGRAYVLDAGQYLSRSGPRFADGLELLAALLHPDRLSGVPLAGRAARWP
jgi:iron complex transport system substrate-binding protein